MRATQQRGPSFAAPAGRASGRHRIFLQRGEREALNKPECAPSSSGQEGGGILPCWRAKSLCRVSRYISKATSHRHEEWDSLER